MEIERGADAKLNGADFISIGVGERFLPRNAQPDKRHRRSTLVDPFTQRVIFVGPQRAEGR